MPADVLVHHLHAWSTWLAGDGRPHVFVGLMASLLAAFVVASLRQARMAPPESPVFYPPRRPAPPDDARWHPDAELAAALLEAGRALEAVQAYRRLLAATPGDADALFNLGHAYFHLRLYAQARACWRAVRRLEPLAPDARANLRLVGRLLAAQHAGRRPGRPQTRLRPLRAREGAQDERQA